MKTTIITHHGTITFNPEDPDIELFDIDGPLFFTVEDYFNEWILYVDKETEEMYRGSFEEFEGGSYLDVKGAIIDGINAICEYAYENGKQFMGLKDLRKIDFEGVFQP